MLYAILFHAVAAWTLPKIMPADFNVPYNEVLVNVMTTNEGCDLVTGPWGLWYGVYSTNPRNGPTVESTNAQVVQQGDNRRIRFWCQATSEVVEGSDVSFKLPSSGYTDSIKKIKHTRKVTQSRGPYTLECPRGTTGFTYQVTPQWSDPRLHPGHKLTQGLCLDPRVRHELDSQITNDPNEPYAMAALKRRVRAWTYRVLLWMPRKTARQLHDAFMATTLLLPRTQELETTCVDLELRLSHPGSSSNP